MKVLSICSGIAGLDSYFHDEPFEIVGFAENNKYCSDVLRYHFPQIKNYGDINDTHFNELPEFDVLLSGTPCQSFSISGNRKGLSGKSGLFYSFLEILKAYKPSYFVHENVTGMLSSNRGWDFANIIAAYDEAGYDVRWQVLDGRDFGIPQRRERVFTIGVRREKCIREIFSKEFDLTKYVTRGKNNNKNNENFIAYSKSTRAKHIDHRIRIDDCANTQTCGDGCRTQSSANYWFNGSRLRKVTPLEAERLHGFRDNWTEYGLSETGERYRISDSQRYKMVGNAVIPQCTEPIFDLIKEHEAYVNSQ